MSEDAMKTQNISIVSVHPDPANALSLDIKDILTALAPELPRWTWCVRNLDWLGKDADALCLRAENAGPQGYWISSEELLGYARNVYQTIEGQFLAFPKDVGPMNVPLEQLQISAFADSAAELGIVAVDGGFFDVYAKDAANLSLLRQLGDVREEDTKMYF
jgi:hypothetical protein